MATHSSILAWKIPWTEEPDRLESMGSQECIYGIQKDGNDDPICETAKETHVKNRLLDSVGEGESGMIWENSTETYIIICEIDRHSRFSA